MRTRYVVLLSATDPVADRVAEVLRTGPATGDHVDGVPLRWVAEGTVALKRPGPHLHDERLDLSLPAEVRRERPTLLVPSVHRSEQNLTCLTVHPLGNLGPRAELGGRARRVVPADPRSMAAALHGLSEGGAAAGFPATYEATHHGPELGLPAFFVEIGYGRLSEHPAAAVEVLARTVSELEPDPRDRVALGVGGGHYAPHFTELALRRHWAFGHLVSRHALEDLDGPTARSAYERSGEAEGIVCARAQDGAHPALQGLGRRLRDADAPRRAAGRTDAPASRDGRPSGT